jgi:glutathione S-transferase
VPVLLDAAAVFAGPAAIVDHLERSRPQPPLYPADPAERQRALEIQAWFDEQVGAPVRAAFFYDVLPEAGYAAGLYSDGRAMPVRAAYRALFPLVRPVMRAQMRLTAERAAHGRERAAEAFAFVAAHAGGAGYLVGDRFTVADLAAASLLSPGVVPPEFPYQPPRPWGAAFAAWMARWADHPGAAWVRTMYARHRGTSAAVA